MIGDAQTVISILGLTMLGTAGLLALLPVGTCSQCSHCRLEKLAKQRDGLVGGQLHPDAGQLHLDHRAVGQGNHGPEVGQPLERWRLRRPAARRTSARPGRR